MSSIPDKSFFSQTVKIAKIHGILRVTRILRVTPKIIMDTYAIFLVYLVVTLQIVESTGRIRLDIILTGAHIYVVLITHKDTPFPGQPQPLRPTPRQHIGLGTDAPARCTAVKSVSAKPPNETAPG